MSSEENQFNVQGYNIVTMLKRLEAATHLVRLEDISIFQTDNRSDGQSMRSVGQGQGAAAAGQSVQKNEAKAVEGGEQEETVPKSVVEFKHFIEKSIIPFVKNFAQAIDDLVGKAAETFEQAFQDQLQFLSIVAKSKKPEMSDPAFMEVLKPINEKIEQINQVKDSNRAIDLTTIYVPYVKGLRF